MNESITLYFKEGTSDKVYQAELNEQSGKYVVNFAYGRRGRDLKTGTKTPSPVSYEEAKLIYDELVNSKLKKGYQP